MCPTLTVGSFFRLLRFTFLVTCLTTSNLNNFEPQQLEPQKRVQNEKKKQNRRPEPRYHTKDPPIAPLFSALCDFFETFWIAPKGPPFNFFDILQHNGCQKTPNGPPFYIFGTVTLFKNLIFKIILGNFFKSLRAPPQIFHILQPAGVSQSPRGPTGKVSTGKYDGNGPTIGSPPFTILSLRYSADFGRSRLVFSSDYNPHTDRSTFYKQS